MNPVSPRILCLAGSARGQSLNARLAALVARELMLRNAEVRLISLGDYPMPLYDGDLEAERGVPEGAERLRGLLCRHEGVFIASPEYNRSIPPLLKNALDWVSRVRSAEGDPSPWRRRVYALGAVSPGAFAGIRGLAHLRQVLEGAFVATVLPEEVTIARGSDAFDDKGGVVDERTAERIERLCDRLVEEAARFA